jgi:hypothetical protein
MIWLLLGPFDLLINLLAFPLAPLIVLLTSPAGAPPTWAWPWLTDDNPIDGDAGHQLRWPDHGTWLRRYCRRVAWLWRNRGYGFSTKMTGRTCSGPSFFVGDRLVSDDPYHPGACYITNGQLWEYYAILPVFGTRLYLRFRFGWKIPLTRDSCMEAVSLCTHISIRYNR